MVYFRHVVKGLTPVGTSWSSTLHSSGSASLASTQTAWNQFCTTFFGTTMAPMWNTHTTVAETSTYQLDPVTGKSVQVLRTPNPIPGTGTGGSQSARASMVFSLYSALSGKPGRGRMYIPTPDDTHFQTTGQLVAADATTLESGFRSAWGTLKLTTVGVVWHKAVKLGDAVVDIELNINVGTQRRRTNKAARVTFGGPV